MSTTTNKESHASNAKQTFDAWEQERERLFALIAAVNTRLAKDEDYFNEVKLLDIAEDILGSTREVRHLKELMGVPV